MSSKRLFYSDPEDVQLTSQTESNFHVEPGSRESLASKTLKQWRSEFVSRWSNNQFIDRYIWDSNWTWEQIQSFFAVRASSHHQCVSCASSLCLSITHSDTFTPTHTESEPSVLAEVGHSLSLSLSHRLPTSPSSSPTRPPLLRSLSLHFATSPFPQCEGMRGGWDTLSLLISWIIQNSWQAIPWLQRCDVRNQRHNMKRTN